MNTPKNTEDTDYDEHSLLIDRFVTRFLVELNLLLQLASYAWMFFKPKDSDDLAVKIVLLGFVASLVFIALCIISFFRQRAYRSHWTAFDRSLYRLNFYLLSYPVLMGIVIYVMASLYPE